MFFQYLLMLALFCGAVAVLSRVVFKKPFTRVILDLVYGTDEERARKAAGKTGVKELQEKIKKKKEKISEVRKELKLVDEAAVLSMSLEDEERKRAEALEKLSELEDQDSEE